MCRKISIISGSVVIFSKIGANTLLNRSLVSMNIQLIIVKALDDIYIVIAIVKSLLDVRSVPLLR